MYEWEIGSNSARILSAANTDAQIQDTNAPPSHIILTPGQQDTGLFV